MNSEAIQQVLQNLLIDMFYRGSTTGLFRYRQSFPHSVKNMVLAWGTCRFHGVTHNALIQAFPERNQAGDM